MATIHRRGLAGFLVTAVLLLCACREGPPVEHQVTLRFQADGALTVEVRSTLRLDPDHPDINATRVQPLIDRYHDGRDEWLERMGEWGLTGIEHSLEVEQSDGKENHRIRRSGRTGSPVEVVPAIFANEPAFVDLAVESGLWTLEVIALSEPRDLRENREEAKRNVARLAERLADTQEKMKRIYLYLRENPERRAPLLREMEIEIRGGDGDDARELSEFEASLLKAVEDSADQLLWRDEEIAVVDRARLHPLDENLEVVLPWEAFDATGFEESEPGHWRLPRVDLDHLLFEMLDEPFHPRFFDMSEVGFDDEAALLARSFEVDPLPFAGETRKRMWEEMTARHPFRLRWTEVPPEGEESPEGRLPEPVPEAEAP